MTEKERLLQERTELFGRIQECYNEMEQIEKSSIKNPFKIIRLKRLREKVQELEEEYSEVLNFIQDNYESVDDNKKAK